MKKILTMICGMLLTAMSSMNAKTLVVYYSYTNNCHDIVQTLSSQIDTDVMRIEPADKTQKYEANGYAIGTKLLNAIKAAPNDAASYPAIDPVSITDLTPYQTIIIVTPLWWSQMAAIMQTYLFHHGAEMAGKNIGLIVSSASSGISGVVNDCKRLVPNGKYFSENLWIKNSNRSNRSTLIKNWLTSVNYNTLTAIKTPTTKSTTTHNYYSLSGQRLTQAPKRRIFIANGKKVIR